MRRQMFSLTTKSILKYERPLNYPDWFKILLKNHKGIKIKPYRFYREGYHINKLGKAFKIYARMKQVILYNV